MISRTCSFTTERLLAREWRSLSDEEWLVRDLADVVQSLLTEGVTRSLPEPWQGAYTTQRSAEWIRQRDAEGTTLLVVDHSSRQPVGLVILFEMASEGGTGPEIRLGYLLAESVWGQGLASELIGGFVDWSREAGIVSIVGGVERDNVGSRRVLEKNGFVCDPATEQASEQMFELRL